MTVKIGVLVGSTRKNSFNRIIANKVIDLLPERYEGEIVEIGQLPLYNQDYDLDNPKEYDEFREKLREYDAFIFQIPEHNRSFPAAIKNALDIGSRPWGKNIWSGKPAAVFAASMGGAGGFGANYQLRQVLSVLNMPLLNQPEVCIPKVHTLINKEGEIVQDTLDFIENAVKAFVNHVDLYVK